MPALIKADDLTGAAFLEVLGAMQIPDADRPRLRLWATTAAGWTFDYWRGLEEPVAWYTARQEPVRRPAGEVLAQSLEGRLFGPGGELRWRRIPALGERSTRTVFLGDQDWLPGQLGDVQPVASLGGTALRRRRDRTDALLLWGRLWRDHPHSEGAASEWIELQIPHRIVYPSPEDAERLVVEVEVWTDERGEAHFVRFCDLLPAA